MRAALTIGTLLLLLAGAEEAGESFRMSQPEG
jgi:hypothetical protein